MKAKGIPFKQGEIVEVIENYSPIITYSSITKSGPYITTIKDGRKFRTCDCSYIDSSGKIYSYPWIRPATDQYEISFYSQYD